jgi:allantoin racemase
MRRIHLLTPVSSKGFRTLWDIAHLSSPELGFTHSELDRGPPSIECEYGEAFADCMGDPGLKPVREVVSIPIVGAAMAAICAKCSDDERRAI